MSSASLPFDIRVSPEKQEDLNSFIKGFKSAIEIEDAKLSEHFADMIWRLYDLYAEPIEALEKNPDLLTQEDKTEVRNIFTPDFISRVERYSSKLPGGQDFLKKVAILTAAAGISFSVLKKSKAEGAFNDVLTLPPKIVYVVPNTNNVSRQYKVEKGDTLWSISKKFNLNVGDIKKLNGLTSNNIVTGRSLNIPTNKRATIGNELNFTPDPGSSSDTGMQAPDSENLSQNTNQNIYKKVAITAPYIAITFDDGPHPQHTPRLLDILKDRNIKATFYVTGENASRYPEIIRRIFDEGHEIGNHSWSHERLTDLSDNKVIEEMEKTHQKIFNITGVYPKNMRPPYEATNERIAELCQKKWGYTTMLWNVDPRDWEYRNASNVHSEILANTQNGSIILVHDIHKTSVDAMPSTLDALLQKGFEFHTVTGLVNFSKKQNFKLAVNRPKEVNPADLKPEIEGNVQSYRNDKGFRREIDKMPTLPELLENGGKEAKKKAPPVAYSKKSNDVIKYNVSRGDTLFSIAKKHGLKVEDILSYNDIENKNIIEIGKVLKLPKLDTNKLLEKRYAKKDPKDIFYSEKGKECSRDASQVNKNIRTWTNKKQRYIQNILKTYEQIVPKNSLLHRSGRGAHVVFATLAQENENYFGGFPKGAAAKDGPAQIKASTAKHFGVSAKDRLKPKGYVKVIYKMFEVNLRRYSQGLDLNGKVEDLGQLLQICHLAYNRGTKFVDSARSICRMRGGDPSNLDSLIKTDALLDAHKKKFPNHEEFTPEELCDINIAYGKNTTEYRRYFDPFINVKSNKKVRNSFQILRAESLKKIENNIIGQLPSNTENFEASGSGLFYNNNAEKGDIGPLAQQHFQSNKKPPKMSNLLLKKHRVLNRRDAMSIGGSLPTSSQDFLFFISQFKNNPSQESYFEPKTGYAGPFGLGDKLAKSLGLEVPPLKHYKDMAKIPWTDCIARVDERYNQAGKNKLQNTLARYLDGLKEKYSINFIEKKDPPIHQRSHQRRSFSKEIDFKGVLREVVEENYQKIQFVRLSLHYFLNEKAPAGHHEPSLHGLIEHIYQSQLKEATGEENIQSAQKKLKNGKILAGITPEGLINALKNHQFPDEIHPEQRAALDATLKAGCERAEAFYHYIERQLLNEHQLVENGEDARNKVGALASTPRNDNAKNNRQEKRSPAPISLGG